MINYLNLEEIFIQKEELVYKLFLFCNPTTNTELFINTISYLFVIIIYICYISN